MKVLFIVPYPVNTAPSQRLKFEQYFDYFRREGITLEVASFVTPAFRKIIYKQGHFFKKISFTCWGYLRRIGDIFKALNFDIIYLHLEAAPFGPHIFEYILHKLRKPIIYDIDDIIYIPHTSKANSFIRYLKSYGKIPRIMALSSHVIVVTQYLKKFAERYNKNVTYIPPTINTERYLAKDHGNGRKVCIGWTGSYSTTEYLLILENVLRKISVKYDVRIKVIGDENFKIKGLNIESKAWFPEEEIADILDMDIGLYPLPDNEWIMGKGGLKALQYMGMGIPVVCTRVGAVLDFIDDGRNGFLAATQEEWLEKIALLIKSLELRKKLGMAGRITVEQKYSVAVNAPEYLKVLKAVYNQRYGKEEL